MSSSDPPVPAPSGGGLRRLVVGGLALMGLMQLVASLLIVHAGWQDRERAAAIANGNRVADDVFAGIPSLGFERGRTVVLLAHAEPADDAQRRALAEWRASSDAALVRARRGLAPQAAEPLNRATSALAAVRRAVDDALGRPLADRDPSATGEVAQRFREVFEQLDTVVRTHVRHAAARDSVFDGLIDVRLNTMRLRASIGDETSPMVAASALGAVPPPALVETVRRMRSRTDAAWWMLEHEVALADAPAITAALGGLHEAVFGVLRRRNDEVLGAWAQARPSPIPAPAYSGLAVATLEAFVPLMRAISAEAGERAGQLESAARLRFGTGAALLLGTLGVMVFGISAVSRRVVGPIEDIASAARAVASGAQRVQVEERGVDELRALAAQFNRMLRAETVARERGERFARVFDTTPDAMAISRASDGLYVEVNRHWGPLLGYRREDMVGRTSVQIDVWADPAERRALAERIRREREARKFEARLRRRDGEEVVAELSCALFVEGGEEYLLTVVHDVTEARAAQRALRESEQRLALTFELIPEAVIVVDMPGGEFVEVNRHWEVTFGWPKSETIGRGALDLDLWVDPADRDRAREAIQRDGSVPMRAYRMRRRDGRELDVEMAGRVLEDGGRRFAVWILRDVTGQRAAERRIRELNSELEERVRQRTSNLERANAELEETLRQLERAHESLVRSEKLAALGALVAGIAHELNTPIGNCVTVASALRDQTVEFDARAGAAQMRRSELAGFTSSARDAAELLLRNLARAHELIASFKQVSVDQTSEKRRPFDLRKVLDEVATTLRAGLRKSPYTLRVDVAPGIAMEGYPGAIGQIVTNFVSNAVMHGFDGRGAGTMTLSAREPGADTVELEFTDDGSGISDEHLRHVFDPFFTTKLGKGGSGLGLNIVYNLATQVLGGEIRVESVPGKGTRFALSLPRRAPPRPDPDED